MTLEDRILFVDGEIIVLDKPAGLPVDTPRRGGNSIESRLEELTLGFKKLPTPMHRLDQDTSGCLLLARHPQARKWAQAMFEEHKVEKTYLAVLGDVIEGEEGLIDLPLDKVSSADAGWRMTHDPKGKQARTRWRKIAEKDGRTLVEFAPETGRTHQIRVHAREGLGVGIVGDRVYGYPGGEMLLHAWKLATPRKKGHRLEVTAPLPDYFGEWKDHVPG